MKKQIAYPVIDVPKTGKHIKFLMAQKGLAARDVTDFLGFEYTRAVYHWLNGQSLPTVDHLCALSKLLEVPMDDILILKKPDETDKQQARPRAGRYRNKLELYGLLMTA